MKRGDKAPRGRGRFDAVLLNVLENGHVMKCSAL